MYGGIEEPKDVKADTKIVPTGDIFSMKLSQSKFYLKTSSHTSSKSLKFSNHSKRLARF